MKSLFLVLASLALSIPAFGVGEASALPWLPAPRFSPLETDSAPLFADNDDQNAEPQDCKDPDWTGWNRAVSRCGIPTPSGIYVLNEASNEQSTATAYAAGLVSSRAYQNDITGHAIFVPIGKILPSIATWCVFDW